MKSVTLSRLQREDWGTATTSNLLFKNLYQIRHFNRKTVRGVMTEKRMELVLREFVLWMARSVM